MLRPRTQSLVLEFGYNYEEAQYTVKPYHYETNGKLYPSLLLLYMQEGDPTEYAFAEKYFLSWSHWMKFSKSRLAEPHVAEWREELEMRLRSQATKSMLHLTRKNHFLAAKWLAEKGWTGPQVAGRPSKEEVTKQAKILAKAEDEYAEDIKRMGRLQVVR